MLKLPKPNLEFLKNNRQIIFSFAVTLLVPALVVLNTYVILSETRKAFDIELRSKAILAAQGLYVTVTESQSSRGYLKSEIDKYIKQNNDVKKITLTEKDGDDFWVVTSPNPDDVGKKVPKDEQTQYVLAWYSDKPFAKMVQATTSETIGEKKIEKGELFWTVITPIMNSEGDKVYLAKVMVSVEDINNLYAATQQKAFLITVGIIVVIVVMVFANGQLFQYTILFQRLKEVDQMKDDFISIASHELRTPLTVIRGDVEMLEDDLREKNLKPKDKAEIMENIQIGVKRLDALVADVLDVSRIEQGRMSYELSPVNLGSVLREVVGEMTVSAKEKGLKVIEHYPDGEIISELDPARLKQVLVNLIGNSVKYTKEGEIEISLLESGEFNKVVIRDTGIGMNEEERAKLFTKFYRVKNQQTNSIMGTGLGLWITKQIVEQMKGKIMVDSIKDVGSEFTILFPKTKQDKKRGKKE